MKKAFLFLCLILLFGIMKGQQNIDDYDKTCYCSGKTPHSVLRYDNNWQLLWAFKSGLSKSGLDSLHIPYTDSQLRLLSIFKLIRVEGDKYYTDIPILDSNKTNQLRIRSKEIAESIIPFINNDIKSLVSYLNSTNYSENQFSILFSYILDGLVWDKFEEKKLITPLNLTTSNYPWVGAFWLLTPARKTSHGTNTFSDSTFKIGITSGCDKLTNGGELINLMLRNYIDKGKVTDENVLKAFGQYYLFNQNGELTIPIIVENNQNELYVLASQIADKICLQLVSNSIFNKVIGDFNFTNKENAVIIMYHEVMWDLLAKIEEIKLIEKPLIITNPSKAEMKDASKLVYIVRKN